MEKESSVTNNNFMDTTAESIDAAGRFVKNTVDILENISAYSRAAQDGELAARERAINASERKAKIEADIYSNEIAKEQNRRYREYMEESIADNFNEKVAISEEKIILELNKTVTENDLNRKKADVEIEIRRMIADAEFECEKIRRNLRFEKEDFERVLELRRREIENSKNKIIVNKVKMWVWRILWPVLGAGLGALTYYLLNVNVVS
jgi:hypothetical protein